MLKAVVFDLDGTLLDTIPDIAAAMNDALERSGLPTHPVRDYEGFVGGGVREAVRASVPEGISPELFEQVLRGYRAYYLAHSCDHTRPYPGVETMLRTLEERGVSLGILSNKSEDLACEIAGRLFPDVSFTCVHGRVDGRALKPDPAAAAPVLERMDCRPEEIAYVGDSGTDMTFAVAVGMLPVAAPWGYRSREQLLACGARLLPKDPEELLELLLERVG